MKVLVTGWFSYRGYGATAGDLLARDVVCDWLSEAHREYQVVNSPPFQGGITWDMVNPEDYSDLVFVCGPFGNGGPIPELLKKFDHCRLYGVNLSMLQSLDDWNPFDVLFERDSNATVRPDVTFLAQPQRVPVVGVVLVHPQSEYGDRALHQDANRAIRRLLQGRHVAQVEIDTRLDDDQNALGTPEEILSVIAKMDVVITTRLHGTVLALKCGVPVLPIDPIRGGAKVSKQVRCLGWPVLIKADALDVEQLEHSLDYCLSDDARQKAAQCAQNAMHSLADTESRFVELLST